MIIKMELLSDALPGCGDGLAGIVDTDVEYDALGLPQISGRRIKGLLREALDELDAFNQQTSNADALFGRGGMMEGRTFYIGSGCIENAEAITAVLKPLKNSVARQRVLDFYSYTRDQTKLEDGTAAEGSLRTMRLLRKGLCFHFPVDCPSEQLDALREACAWVKQFGIARTRGHGQIRLSLIDDHAAPVEPQAVMPDLSDADDSAPMQLTVDVCNHAELILVTRPGIGTESERYIPGRALLAVCAKRCLRARDAVDDDFYARFADGDVVFSNLYPVEDDHIYTPVPVSYRQIKDSDQCIDFAEIEDRDAYKDAEFKGSPSGFVYKHTKMDTRRMTRSHHRRPDDKGYGRVLNPENGHKGDEGAFFQFNTLAAGQVFRGTITGPAKHIRRIRDVLVSDKTVYLGKSRSGQYARSEITSLTDSLLTEETVSWPAGETLRFDMQSDVLVRNEKGLPCADVKAFISALEQQFTMASDAIKLDKAFVSQTASGGFHSVWKLPRHQLPAFTAGSVILLKNASSAASLPKQFALGLRQAEGCGCISVSTPEEEEPFTLFPAKESRWVATDVKSEAKELFFYIGIQEFRRQLTVRAAGKVKKITMVNSFCSRLRGVLQTAHSIDDFHALCGSFKNETKKTYNEKVKEWAEPHAFTHEVDQAWSAISEPLRKGLSSEDMLALQQQLAGYESYKLYIETILTGIKLKNRHKENTESVKKGGSS